MKRLTTLLLVVVVLASLLAACAPATPEVIEKEVIVEKEVPVTVEVVKEVVVEKEVVKEVVVTPEAGGLPESPTLEEVQKRGVLRVGAVLGMPTIYKDPKTGKLEGYALTILREGANRLGVDVEFIESSWDGIIAGLQAEKYDLAAAGLFQTEKRKKAIDFVDVYMTGICFLAKEQTELNTLEDLNSPDVKIGTVQGSGSEQMVEEGLPKAELVSVPTTGGAGAPIELVLSGRADVVQVDDVAADAWTKRYCGLKIIPSDCWERHPFGLPIGWGVRKGDPGWQKFWEQVTDDYAQLIVDQRTLYRQFEYRFPGEPTPVCP